jgi:P27 family predicted phage terminase small subunit
MSFRGGLRGCGPLGGNKGGEVKKNAEVAHSAARPCSKSSARNAFFWWEHWKKILIVAGVGTRFQVPNGPIKAHNLEVVLADQAEMGALLAQVGFLPTRLFKSGIGRKSSILELLMQKLPENVHRLRGNPSKRRHLKGIAPAPLPEVPVAPSFLSPTAAEEWTRLAPTLHGMGLLSPLDLQPFGVYCQAVGTWHDAVQASATASPEAQPALAGIIRTAARDTLKYARFFGLTPSSRSSVSAVPSQVDKFDGLIPA